MNKLKIPKMDIKNYLGMTYDGAIEKYINEFVVPSVEEYFTKKRKSPVTKSIKPVKKN